MTIEWIVNNTKRCCSCKEYKPFGEFHKDKSGHAGLAYSCKLCANHRSKANHARRHAEVPEYRVAKKDAYIRYKFGITLEEYETKLASQNHTCPICGTTEPVGGWHLDHNHTTGAIRDFLCSSCNRGIGYMYENIESLKGAIAYLERHNENGNRKVGTSL